MPPSVNRRRALATIGSFVAAPWLAPYPYDAQHLDRTWQGPSAQHLLGTFQLLGLPVLDGSKSSCDWKTDADAVQPGLFGTGCQ